MTSLTPTPASFIGRLAALLILCVALSVLYAMIPVDAKLARTLVDTVQLVAMTATMYLALRWVIVSL